MERGAGSVEQRSEVRSRRSEVSLGAEFGGFAPRTQGTPRKSSEKADFVPLNSSLPGQATALGHRLCLCRTFVPFNDSLVHSEQVFYSTMRTSTPKQNVCWPMVLPSFPIRGGLLGLQTNMKQST